MRWLEKIPLAPLVLAAIFLALMPFRPPHLWEKFGMLMEGRLTQMVDIVDVFWHLSLLVLVLIKVILAKRKAVSAS